MTKTGTIQKQDVFIYSTVSQINPWSTTKQLGNCLIIQELCSTKQDRQYDIMVLRARG